MTLYLLGWSALIMFWGLYQAIATGRALGSENQLSDAKEFHCVTGVIIVVCLHLLGLLEIPK